ncbi:hypothetical protein [Fusobacterium sp.]|uniref:hypothetical protein n=1 Tax=Fusobacterium sp. TaxID=68766 RepID=UPI00290121F2|nr:hypothetical protein [Fusobacterium sp.]MDU1912012.1 hypothetical protein [Fusobacterium sp.]
MKKFIFIIVLVLGGFFLFTYKNAPKNISLSSEEFRIAAEKFDYTVSDYKNIVSGKEQLFSGEKCSLVAEKSSKTYTGDKVKTHIWYYLFETDEQAYNFFFFIKEIYSSKKVMPPGTYEFKWDNKSRIFGNTQYYNQIGNTGVLGSIWRVDNTVIFAEYFWSERPSEFFNHVGYKY